MSHERQARAADAEEAARAGALDPSVIEETEALLGALRGWLVELERGRHDRSAARPELVSSAVPEIDLATLVSEMIALRREVQLEARASKASRVETESTVGSFREFVGTLAESQRADLDEGMRQIRAAIRDAGRGADRALLEVLLDVHDVHERGLAAASRARDRLGWRRLFVPRDLVASLIDGYRLGLERLERSLARLGVERVEARGNRFDPQIMRAVETVVRRGFESGQVVEELRAGFTRGGGDHGPGRRDLRGRSPRASSDRRTRTRPPGGHGRRRPRGGRGADRACAGTRRLWRHRRRPPREPRARRDPLLRRGEMTAA